MPAIDRARLADLLAAEQAHYTEAHPRSRALFEQADHLFGRVPMTWMNKWSGGFPLYLDHARGNRISDVDGHTYVDFALGDTGAMAGHSPRATVEAVGRRMGDLGGITTMLPSADAQEVGAELTRRFGMPLWSFTLSATDANRWAVRLVAVRPSKDPAGLLFDDGVEDVTEITWHPDDALPEALCLAVDGIETAVAWGNIVLADHGQSVRAAALGTPTLIVVDFWAEWCVPCKAVSHDLDRWLATQPEGSVTLIRAETDFVAAARGQ